MGISRTTANQIKRGGSFLTTAPASSREHSESRSLSLSHIHAHTLTRSQARMVGILTGWRGSWSSAPYSGHTRAKDGSDPPAPSFALAHRHTHTMFSRRRVLRALSAAWLAFVGRGEPPGPVISGSSSSRASAKGCACGGEGFRRANTRTKRSLLRSTQSLETEEKKKRRCQGTCARSLVSIPGSTNAARDRGALRVGSPPSPLLSLDDRRRRARRSRRVYVRAAAREAALRNAAS